MMIELFLYFIDVYYNGGRNADFIGTNAIYGALFSSIAIAGAWAYADYDFDGDGVMLVCLGIVISTLLLPYVVAIVGMIVLLSYFIPWINQLGKSHRERAEKKQKEQERIDKEVKSILGEK